VFVVDTNLLLYAADRAAPEHAKARQLLEGWRGQPLPWYVTWGIVYEFLRVVTHPRVLRRPWTELEAWGFVGALLGSPALQMLVETERHRQIAGEVISQVRPLRGNLFHDAHTAILMREHGVQRIYTRDTEFHRFPFLDVVDPLA
jgi:toxin-antitoxin system PIN domain toxin